MTNLALATQQKELFEPQGFGGKAPSGQLLKWIGNKQRVAASIIRHFPSRYGMYWEPFLGSGAVLATLAPRKAIAADVFSPLLEIWRTLQSDPALLKDWYEERWEQYMGDRLAFYEFAKARYNKQPNGADLLFLCRTCYGGVVRFRKADGYMSTPCGPHSPIPPENFNKRVDEWHERTIHTTFQLSDFEATMREARAGDLIYCDPPYAHSQSILYGAQSFSLERLFEVIESCKKRGVFVALSIDGTKRSGDFLCDVKPPSALFEREVFVQLGRSMLKRFQMEGRSLESEAVADRLLLTY